MTVKIAHISDIHWRSLKRHEEYKIVFEDLFKNLKKNVPDMIFLGGDIVHSKTQSISPELVENLTWWFNSLADIAPTHIILGNHDGLILNKDRQDAITPIVNAINNKNIFLYKKSGVYPAFTSKEGKIFNWCVFSCFDEENWKNVLPIENDINIACFHGAVWGSKTDVDWELEGEVNLSMFDGFDFGFLGDIHKYQFLDKEKRVAYPGSTIQQNYGEDIQKGYLLWEINDKYTFKSNFIKLNNPYPYVTINWQENIENTIRFCEKVKKNSRFRIKSQSAISQAEIKLLYHYLKHEKNAKEIVFQNLNKDTVLNKNNLSSNKVNDVLDIRNKNSRLKLLNQFFCNLSQEELEKINKLYEESLDKTSIALDSTSSNWSISSLEFNNTFSYGKNNFINFNNLNGVIGLFGNNRTGKSSIPGTLMYALYNTSDRGSIKNQDIVNTRKGFCDAKVKFSIGSENYEVKRETIKKTNKKGITSATTNLSLKNTSSGNSDITEEQRRETDKIVRRLIGTADDFLYTSFASQGEMNTFIKEKSSARRAVLSKFLNLDLYEEIFKNSRENYIVLKNKLKNSTEKNWPVLIKDIEEEKIKNEKNKININKNLEKLRNKEVDLKLEIKEIEKNIKNHPSGYDFHSAKSQLSSLLILKEDLQKDLALIKNKIKENTQSLESIEKFKLNYPVKDLEKDSEKLSVLVNKLKDFKFKRDQIKKDFSAAESEIKILDEVPCEDKFPGCKFIKNAYESKNNIKELLEDIRKFEIEIFSLQNTVKALKKENIDQKIKKYNEVLQKEYKLKVDNKSLLEKIEVKSDKIKSISKDIDNIENIILELQNYTNDGFNVKFNKLKTELKEIAGLIYSEERSLSNNIEDFIEIKNKLNNLIKEKKDYNNLLSEWKIFDFFNLANSKKGIPSMLISSCLPSINNEINNILSGVVNFKISIEDNENNLDVYIDYGDSRRIIECASGMEKMMTSIAIRVALINISSLPKSDVFIIDEGFGALDDSNIDACAMLLKSLKKYFKTIIIISHVDSIKDIVDKQLEISLKGKDSYVEYR